jgi:hypothetical protein
MSMKHSPAEILIKLLTADNKLSDPVENKDWPGYVGHSPETPDNCVTAFDTTPIIVARELATGGTCRLWGVQLRLRTAKDKYPLGWDKINGLDDHLTSLHNALVSFEDAVFAVDSVCVDSGPMFIGQDEQSRRNLFTLNLLANIHKK